MGTVHHWGIGSDLDQQLRWIRMQGTWDGTTGGSEMLRTEEGKRGRACGSRVGLRLRNGITLLKAAEVLTASLADGIGILVALPNELLAWLALVVEVAERGEEIRAEVVDGGRRRRRECGSGHRGQSNEGVFHPRRLCVSIVSVSKCKSCV